MWIDLIYGPIVAVDDEIKIKEETEGNFKFQQRGTYRNLHQRPMETYRKRYPNQPRFQMGRYNSMEGIMMEAMEKMIAVMKEINHANFYV